MPELTEQDIADMKLDKLSPAIPKTVVLPTESYGLVDVVGYYDRIKNTFEVHKISLCKMDDETDSEHFESIHYVERNQEQVRSFIQDNYEDKLVEACL